MKNVAPLLATDGPAGWYATAPILLDGMDFPQLDLGPTGRPEGGDRHFLSSWRRFPAAVFTGRCHRARRHSTCPEVRFHQTERTPSFAGPALAPRANTSGRRFPLE